MTAVVDNTPEYTLHPHTFHIADRESMFFHVEKVNVEYAELFINDVLMAVCVLGKGVPVDLPPVEQCALDFFNGLPLHRALLACPVRVVIYTFDDATPSICMQMVDTLTWEMIGATELVVDVSVSTRAGAVGKRLVYCPQFAGYIQ